MPRATTTDTASTANATAETAERGVAFPAGDDAEVRPTTPTVRGIVADAARAVDPALAARAENAPNWREAYLGVLRDLTMTTAATPEAAVTIARDGLAAARTRLHVVTDAGEQPLDTWAFEDAVHQARGSIGSETVRGTRRPVTSLAVPYRGRELSGNDLERQLDTWVDGGVIEASCAAAVKRVINHPEWLSLPGHVVAEVGAGAEMGPLEMLCRWGARVLAIDIPHVAGRLEGLARNGAGSVTLPAHPGGGMGADIVRDPAAVTAWIDDQAGDDTVVFGMHAYADSGMHVRLTLAADLIAQYLLSARPSTVPAYLATPTDAFVVPHEIVDSARSRWAEHGSKGVAKKGLRAVSRGQLFSEPYPKGSHVADCLVAQQGPNYAVAKRLQRWRAVAAEADGRRVSFNVAPATLTRSVTKNPLLAAAYGGAHRFGVEVFAPETSRALMAALLVHDVMRDDVAAGTAATRRNPEELFSDNAAHGGLWRTAWAPRSALGVAAVLGAAHLLPHRRR